jgi:Cytochrome P460
MHALGTHGENRLAGVEDPKAKENGRNREPVRKTKTACAPVHGENRILVGFRKTNNAANSQDRAANRGRCDTRRMHPKTAIVILIAAVLPFLAADKRSTPSSGPEFTTDGELKRPVDYRQWVYLSTGFDMSYEPGSAMGDHHMFDNVFVNAEAYRAFNQTGTWPDKTMLILEVRGANGKGSINQRGNYQSTEVMGLEVHVKDETRFPAKWAFFGFDGAKTAKMVPLGASCYSCHAAHAAVDTTFVQFYPTLLGVAEEKGTLADSYRKENQASGAK